MKITILSLLAASTFASTSLGAASHSQLKNHYRFSRLPKRAAAVADTTTTTTAAFIAEGTLTAAEGCTAYYHVVSGDWCITVSRSFGISLEQFYEWNLGIDSTCSNLYAGEDYCVAATAPAATVVASTAAAPQTTAAAAPPTTAAAAAVTTAVPAATAVAETAPAAQLNAAATAAAAAAEGECDADADVVTPEELAAEQAAAAAAAAGDDEDDEEECEDEDDDDEEEPSSAAAAAASTPAAAAAAATTTAAASSAPAAAASSAPAASSSSSSVLSNVLTSAGITGFLNTNTGAIMSWFRTNSGQDSTNGMSWCQVRYKDNMPGFAPDVSVMLANFGGDYEAAAKAYCGLEATFTTASGVTGTLYILDGFDSAWVRTPASVDVIKGAFATFFGRDTDNKNDVLQGVSWQFTGRRDERYKFKGTG